MLFLSAVFQGAGNSINSPLSSSALKMLRQNWANPLGPVLVRKVGQEVSLLQRLPNFKKNSARVHDAKAQKFHLILLLGVAVNSLIPCPESSSNSGHLNEMLKD